MNKFFRIVLVFVLFSACSSTTRSNDDNLDESDDTLAESEIVAYISVDINPSLSFNINRFKKVVEVEQLNEDAKSIDVSDMVGMDIDEAIEKNVVRAKEAGFIDTSDIESDYVLLTTVLFDETIKDELYQQIQNRIETSVGLQDVNMVQMQVDQQSMEMAEKMGVSAGQFTINQIEEGYSVQEFFQDEARTDQLFEQFQYSVSDINIDHIRLNIQAVLDQLKAKNIDVSEYQRLLNNSTLEELRNLQKELIENYGKSAEDVNENVEEVLKDEKVDYNFISISKEEGIAPVIHITVSSNEVVTVYVLIEADNVYASNSYSVSQVIKGISPAAGQKDYIVIHKVFMNNANEQTYIINLSDYLDNNGGNESPSEGEGSEGPPNDGGGMPVALVVLQDTSGNTSEIIAQ